MMGLLEVGPRGLDRDHLMDVAALVEPEVCTNDEEGAVLRVVEHGGDLDPLGALVLFLMKNKKNVKFVYCRR